MSLVKLDNPKHHKVIFLVDMNAFYASVHQAEDPSLRGKPIIVGGDAKSRKGIVLAKSYECLSVGPVKTAMTIQEALKLVPQAKVLRPDHALYQAYALRIREVMQQFTPLVEPNSIDEAYLDMSGTEKLFGTPYEAAKKIQQAIWDQVGVPCSVGIGATKIAAKMAADFQKPQGISTCWPEEVESKLYPLPVGTLNGVGSKTREKLSAMHILTIGDLARMEEYWLRPVLGKKAGEIIDKARGLGPDQVDPDKMADNRSIGHSFTFDHDLTQRAELDRELYRLCVKTSLRIRKEGLVARTISVSIKNQDFTVTSHARTLQDGIDQTDEVFDHASVLLYELWKHEPVRLLGVSLEHLEQKGTSQLILFEDKDKEKLQMTLDRLRDKFGEDSILKGRLWKD